MNPFLRSPNELFAQYLNFKVQRVDAYPDDSLVIELFSGANKEKVWLFLCPKQPFTDSCFLKARPKKNDGSPPAVQKIFRKELVPSFMVSCEANQDSHLLTLRFKQPNGKQRNLRIEFSNLCPRIFLTNVKPSTEKVLSSIEAKKSSISKKGSTYLSPNSRQDSPLNAGLSSTKANKNPGTRAPESNHVLSHLYRLRKQKGRLHKALKRDLEKHGDSEKLYLWGESLKPYASTIPRGETSFCVPDSEPPLEIRLNEKLNGTENLESFFHRAKRAARAQKSIRPRAAACMEEMRKLNAFILTIETKPDSKSVLDEVDQWLKLHGKNKKGGRQNPPRKNALKRKPYRIFQSDCGAQIWVGRKAIDNATLTFRHASGNDTFFHARGYAGSHVIVKRKLDQLHPELMIDAAHLAGWFSRANGMSRVDIQYTERKHVRKPAASQNPGQVYISNERVIHLIFDEKRLRRLLETEEKH